MERQQLVAIFFICLLANHEARRLEALSNIVKLSQRKTTDDTDAGSGVEAYTSIDPEHAVCGGLGALLRCNKPGCHRKYMWLDKPTQSCRPTDEYKLESNPVFFAKVEVQRLLEKSIKFKKTGCVIGSLFGGKDVYMCKCMRRMQQMLSYLRYVNKLKLLALNDPEHPAYQYVSSSLFNDTMTIVFENIVAGFDKYESSPAGTGLQFGKSWQKLKEIKVLSSKVAPSTDDVSTDDSSTDGPSIDDLEATEEEIASEEVALITGAMLKMVDVQITHGLKAQIQSAAREQHLFYARPVDEVVQLLEGEISASMLVGGIDETALGRLSRDVVTNMKGELSSNQSNLLQLSSNLSVVMRGSGPLKWLYKHGVGWVVARIAWLMIFLMGSLEGIILGGVIFPLLFVSCVLLKFVKWMGLDVLDEISSESDEQPTIEGLRSISYCPTLMWEAVGFDTSPKGVGLPLQVFVEPARFASATTGVVHPLYNRRAPDVQCGSKASCLEGKCVCHPGYYPSAGEGSMEGSCALLWTEHGCACKATWQKRRLILFKSFHLGCPATLRYCEVDKSHPSWNTCKRSALIRKGWAVTRTYDRCTPKELYAPVQSL